MLEFICFRYYFCITWSTVFLVLRLPILLVGSTIFLAYISVNFLMLYIWIPHYFCIILLFSLLFIVVLLSLTFGICLRSVRFRQRRKSGDDIHKLATADATLTSPPVGGASSRRRAEGGASIGFFDSFRPRSKSDAKAICKLPISRRAVFYVCLAIIQLTQNWLPGCFEDVNNTHPAMLWRFVGCNLFIVYTITVGNCLLSIDLFLFSII